MSPHDQREPRDSPVPDPLDSDGEAEANLANALATEALAFLAAYDEEQEEVVTVTRTAEGVIVTDSGGLAPEVAHYLLSVGCAQILDDAAWCDEEGEDGDGDGGEDEEEEVE